MELFEFIRRTPANSLHQMLSFVPRQVVELLDQWRQEIAAGGRPVPDLARLAQQAPAAPVPVRVDAQNTLTGLRGSSVSCPPAGELLHTYLDYFIRSGTLQSPPIPPTG